jgi:hypothetical protein
MLFSVRRLYSLNALVLLAIWLPATSLCLLERANWLSNDECCPSSSEKAPPKDGNNCCVLASAPYKAGDTRPIVPLAILLSFVTIAEPVAAPSEPMHIRLLSPSPPDLPNTLAILFPHGPATEGSFTRFVTRPHRDNS